MMDIEIQVSRRYPCYINIRQHGNLIMFRHSELLLFKAALANAERELLCELPKSLWHEISADYATHCGDK